MRVMISQPMNGKSNEEIRKERAEIVKKIERKGFEYIDTVFEDEGKMNKIIHGGVYYLGKSIEKMAEADIVYFMKGWENARGCKIEHLICSQYRIICEYEGIGGIIDGYKSDKQE